MGPIFNAWREAVEQGRPVALATVLAGPRTGQKLLVYGDGSGLGSLGEPGLDDRVREEAATLLARGESGRLTVPWGQESLDLFVDVQLPPPRLIIVGAVHIAIPLVTFANVLGFRTIVLDARGAFATPERFGHAHELIVRWPADVLPELNIDENTCIVVLTHDEKIDNPALAYAVRSRARYIGALGSRKTHARRVAALKEMGVSDEEIARIRAPIGLDLGGRSPEEIAVAIMAEIVAVRNNAALVDPRR
ncbi:MAG: xanthine and Co dehydrogenase maturation factor [Litorilinea sp.]|nr:MAG: xanthine and Co dehydrogenase maturation factor [Litorilinea sp.]